MPWIVSDFVLCYFHHSHKNRKDSLGTRAKLAVLRTYVENQAIPEPIFLYRALKYKQTKEQGSEDCLWIPIPFYRIIASFFFFFMSRCKQKIKLFYNRLQFVKETQTNTV